LTTQLRDRGWLAFRLAGLCAAVAMLLLIVAAGAEGSFAQEPAADSVEPKFDLGKPSDGPFPSNRFTNDDPSQKTGLQVALPKPDDCTAQPSDCRDIDILNTLD